MDAQELRNLQEAYIEVVENQQLDEALGDAVDRAREKSAKKGDYAASARYRASYRQTKHGFDAPGKRGTKQGIDKETGEPRPGNKWRRRAGKGSEIERNRDTFDENYDLYDIILSHLLDEGYAETPEAAEAIMVNMSEEWRQSILG